MTIMKQQEWLDSIPLMHGMRGDKYIINGKTFIHKNPKWGFGQEEFTQSDELDNYDALFAALKPHWNKLREVPKVIRKTIVLVHETGSCNADMFIPAQYISLASEIGAAWRLGIYSNLDIDANE